MPFTSRGVTIAFHRLDQTPLPRILSEYSGRRFTGRIEIDAACNGVRCVGAIEFLNGDIVASEVTEPHLVRGLDALEYILNTVTETCRGYAEVIELDELRVNIDLRDNPDARLDPRLASKLVKEAVRKLEERLKAKPMPPPPPPRPAPKPPAEVKPASPPPEVVRRVEETPTAPIRVEERRPPMPTAKEKIVEKVKTSDEMFKHIDSPLFDATIVLKGSLAESGSFYGQEVDSFLNKVCEVSRSHGTKVVAVFFSDRANEIRGKIISLNGVITALMTRKDDKTFLDDDALKIITEFQKPILYSIYVIDPEVDKELYMLAQKALESIKSSTEASTETESSQPGVEGSGAEQGGEANPGIEGKIRRLPKLLKSLFRR